MIPQMEPLYGPEEIKAVCKYMRSGGWLTEYKLTTELEHMFCDYLGVKHCIMMPNGTLALYAALSVYSIGLGDYVIVPAMTMIATANAVKMSVGLPCFADIEAETLCLNYSQIENYAKTRPQRKAVIYVSLNGRCGDMEALVNLCKRNNLILIEDAAQSLGSKWHGKALGTFGDVGCFSLSCQKVIGTGNGGFCVTDSDEIAHKLRLFKDFGREAGSINDYTSFGINLKFTDLQATIGIEQVKKLPQRLERKKEMYALYNKLLYDMPGVKFIPTDLSQTAPWFIDVLVERREELIVHLREEHHIQTRPFYPALHQTLVYKATHGWCKLPVSEDVAKRGLWLPSALTLEDKDIYAVCNAIKGFYNA